MAHTYPPLTGCRPSLPGAKDIDRCITNCFWVKLGFKNKNPVLWHEQNQIKAGPGWTHLNFHGGNCQQFTETELTCSIGHSDLQLRLKSGLRGKQKFYSIRGFVMFPQVSLSVSHDGFLHFGDIVCLYNPSTESTLSANMAESKMHDEKKLVGPCDVSASKSTDPCIRNTFVILGCM